MARQNSKSEKSGFFLSLIRSSIILTSIDKFTAYIYSLLKNGLFAYIFSGYKNVTHSSFVNGIRSSKLSHHMGELRYGLCRLIEQSLIVGLIDMLTKHLLKCKLKVYGVFLISFGAYTSVISMVLALISDDISTLLTSADLILSLIIVFASLPLLFSHRNLAEGLSSSRIGRFVLKITGFTLDTQLFDCPKGHSSVAFLLGIFVAVISNTFVSSGRVVAVIGGLLAAVAAYLVLLKPEIGVLSLFFFLPFFPTMVLAAILVYTFLCWVIKVLRGKRVVSFEPLDIVVMFFAVILLSGGFISLSPGSLKPSLLMVCFVLGFFLTTQLIVKREWLVKCSVAVVISGMLVSLYGIFMYYTGGGYFSTAWLDDEMFGGIATRAVSTLENPNMLGEYLIIVIPIAFAMLIDKLEGLRRVPAFLCLGALGVCLLLTWSRGAWLALIVAMIVFVLMWHHRSVWLILAGICSIPILPAILPQSIISRFSSIGNMADSSTSYRVYIWRASVNMLKDNGIAGIGIGEDAWRRMYPMYSYMGVEAAPHSHNLFIQIWLELGIFGIIAFALLIFLILQSAFTMFKKLSSNKPLRISDLSESMMRSSCGEELGNLEAQRRSKTALRLSVVGPLTGLIAVLVQGVTDYSWYNYRLYLFFWLVAGLCVGYIRNGNSFMTDEAITEPSETSADARLVLKENGKKKKRQ